jgi:eukaryotic-like serine/threonine-protein kinase
MIASQTAFRDPEIQRLLDAALDDQGTSWRSGERTPIEDYLARVPALREDAQAILDLIYQEYVLRRELGDDFDPHEYCTRFPDLAQAIMLQLGVDAAIAPSTQALNERDRPNANVDDSIETIAGYEMIALLGRGGMGIVHQARDVKLGRIVAIKTIAQSQHATADQRERFRAEAHAIARLRHPNIIAIHAIGEHEGQPYLSLEFADGGSLAQRLAERPMAPREAAALVETLARAVHVAHQAGVIHRDLKPSNVLLAADGTPKVSDFGLAKLLDADSERTASGQPLGTPSYMAPEQAGGHSKHVGPATDVYSLGAILYQALTGRPPFLGATALETLNLVMTTDVVWPTRLRPDVPRDLESICLKCLEKSPTDRYATGINLAEDLHRFLDGRPTLARPIGPAGRVWRWSRCNPRVAGLSAAVAASLIAGTVVSSLLAFRAMRAEASTRRERDRAQIEANRFKAVNEFVRKDLLAQASPTNQATRETKPDPDLKLRTVLDRAAAAIGARLADQPLVEASIRQTIGDTYSQLGLYAQARAHLERALDLCRSTLSDEAPETFSAMHSLGALLDQDGKWNEAERYLVPAMNGLKRTRGDVDPETLEAIVDVGNLYNELDREKEAEPLLSRALQGLRRTRGAGDILTLRTMDSLAMIYLSEKKSEQANELEGEAVSGMQEALGPDNPNTLLARRNLAATYAAIDQPTEAESRFKDVLADMRRVLGEKHPDTLYTTILLAQHYSYQERLDNVEEYARAALEGSRGVLDDHHQVRTAALAFLAKVYRRRGDFARSEPVLIESVALTRSRWGPDHWLTADGNGAVGRNLLALGKYQGAERYCRDEVEFRIKNSPNDPRRFWAELHLGIALLGQEKAHEAKSLLLSAWNGLRPRAATRPLPTTSDLPRIVEQLLQLTDESGRPPQDPPLDKLRSDPVLRAIVADCEFPLEPIP